MLLAWASATHRSHGLHKTLVSPSNQMAGPHSTFFELGVLLDPLAEGDGTEARPGEDDPAGLLPAGELLQDGLTQLGQAVVLVLGLLGQLQQVFLLVFEKKEKN